MKKKKYFSKKMIEKEMYSNDIKTIEPAWKKQKMAIKNDTAKEFHGVKIFDKDNKLIDDNILSFSRFNIHKILH